MSQTSLTDTQLVILSAAAQREDLRIELPDRLHGGAATAVLTRLLAKSLIERLADADVTDGREPADEEAGYRISRSGLAALGIDGDAKEDEEQRSVAVGAETFLSDPSEPEVRATAAQSLASTSPRAGTKLSDVIALLEREGGASIDELTAATGWLAHTTRAALTGLRKRGLLVERAKRDGGTTIYRIITAGDEAISGEAL